MIRPAVKSSLEELWALTRRADLRLRVHRLGEVATGDEVFRLEVVDAKRAPVVEVTTKDLESAARWILDHQKRRT